MREGNHFNTNLCEYLGVTVAYVWVVSTKVTKDFTDYYSGQVYTGINASTER